MANAIKLSGMDVAVLAKQARSEKPRARGEAYALVQRCNVRLASHAEGKLLLAEEVKLPLVAVERLLWKVRGVALAQWKAARAADAPAAEPGGSAQFEAALAAFVAR
jgi:hypothetical protein